MCGSLISGFRLHVCDFDAHLRGRQLRAGFRAAGSMVSPARRAPQALPSGREREPQPRASSRRDETHSIAAANGPATQRGPDRPSKNTEPRVLAALRPALQEGRRAGRVPCLDTHPSPRVTPCGRAHAAPTDIRASYLRRQSPRPRGTRSLRRLGGRGPPLTHGRPPCFSEASACSWRCGGWRVREAREDRTLSQAQSRAGDSRAQGRPAGHRVQGLWPADACAPARRGRRPHSPRHGGLRGGGGCEAPTPCPRTAADGGRWPWTEPRARPRFHWPRRENNELCRLQRDFPPSLFRLIQMRFRRKLVFGKSVCLERRRSFEGTRYPRAPWERPRRVCLCCASWGFTRVRTSRGKAPEREMDEVRAAPPRPPVTTGRAAALTSARGSRSVRGRLRRVALKTRRALCPERPA